MQWTPGRESDQSPQSSAEVKNEWRYTSTPPYVIMASCLIKHRMSLWRGTQAQG